MKKGKTMQKATVWAALLTLLAFAAFADDGDPMAACDDTYGQCTQKCDAMENAPADCYSNCDDAYQRCLDIANGYTPQQTETKPAAKPAEKNVKTKKGSLPAGEDERTDPDAGGHE